MKLLMLTIGKTTTARLREGIEEYAGRIGHYMPIEIRALADVKAKGKIAVERQKELEGESILGTVGAGDCLVLLDERGKEMTSVEFSQFIMGKANVVSRQLVFAVGGPYGFSKAVYERADAMLSMSRMTFPHELIRLMFVEQLYRAMTIARGEPYHH